MLALAVMPVVFVLGELISLGTCFQVTASELAGIRCYSYRIGGRLRRKDASLSGAAVGIPPLWHWISNLHP